MEVNQVLLYCYYVLCVLLNIYFYFIISLSCTVTYQTCEASHHFMAVKEINVSELVSENVIE